MLSGDGYQNGDENNPPDQDCMEQGVLVEQANECESSSRTASGSGSGSGEDKEVEERQESQRVAEKNNGEPSRVEQAQEDVEMNGSHDGVRGTQRYSSLVDRSPGSITRSGSTKR